jgi:hypothetical protein
MVPVEDEEEEEDMMMMMMVMESVSGELLNFEHQKWLSD